MLPQEFEPGMKKLVTIFNPRGWNEESNDAYFDLVRRWTPGEWDDVVDEAIRSHDWMPKPKTLITLKLDLAGRDNETGDVVEARDCECCFSGLIPFTIERGGLEYEKVAACTCAAGKRRLMSTFGGVRMKNYVEVFGDNPPAIPLKSEEPKTDDVVEFVDADADSLPF